MAVGRPAHQGKQVFQIRHTRQGSGRRKGLLLKAHCDHRRVRVIEQVLCEVRRCHKIGEAGEQHLGQLAQPPLLRWSHRVAVGISGL